MTSLLRTITPIDGTVYVERPLATDSMIDAALDRAANALPLWRRTPLDERRRLLALAVDLMVDRAETIALEITWQIGRPICQSPGELRGFEERARAMIELAPAALAEIVPAEKPGFRRLIRREPHGVVAVLAPWNYPLLTSVNAIVPALLAGNTVILKHSHQTPLVAEHYQAVMDEAGLPPGVFQHAHCSHAQAERLIADRRVGFVAFTGSVAGGHAVQRALSNRFAAAGLELGGKDPAYVRADADLSHAIENLAEGAFFNSGQSCCGIERIYADRRIFDDLVQGLAESAQRLVLGNPVDQATTLGPMVREKAAAFVRDQVQEACRAGARALIEPSRFAADREGTPYLAPQVLIDVDHNMAVMRDETFGPVVGVMKVASDEEAIPLMNDSAFGLTAAIWTSDPAAADAIGTKLDTGTVFMNRCDYLDPALAWTGVKDSGRGCTLSRIGLEQMTRPKSFHFRLET